MDRLPYLPLLLLLVGAAATTAQETQQTVANRHAIAGRKRPINPNKPGGPPSATSPSLTLTMLNQLEEVAAAVRKNGGDIMLGEVPGPIPSQASGDDIWSGLLKTTQLDNPFITQQCRAEAIQAAVHSLGGTEAALEHAVARQEEWKRVLQGEKRVSLSEYLDNTLECNEFCAPLVGALLKCHVQGVGNQNPADRLIFIFDVEVPRAHEQFRFSPAEKQRIVDFAKKMSAENKMILIEARASIRNASESLRYNLELSERRGNLMRQALIDAGFPAEHILMKNLCWEPPRLASEEIAGIYGFAAVRKRLQDPQDMDQSAVLLGYDPK